MFPTLQRPFLSAGLRHAVLLVDEMSLGEEAVTGGRGGRGVVNLLTGSLVLSHLQGGVPLSEVDGAYLHSSLLLTPPSGSSSPVGRRGGGALEYTVILISCGL